MTNVLPFGSGTYFEVSVSPEDVRREKEKARALRKTQWWQRQIGRQVCYYCRKPSASKDLTMDHIVPLIRGGRSTKGNLAPACKECNSRKKYLLPIEWEDYLRDLSKQLCGNKAIDTSDTFKEEPHERM